MLNIIFFKFKMTSCIFILNAIVPLMKQLSYGAYFIQRPLPYESNQSRKSQSGAQEIKS